MCGSWCVWSNHGKRRSAFHHSFCSIWELVWQIRVSEPLCRVYKRAFGLICHTQPLQIWFSVWGRHFGRPKLFSIMGRGFTVIYKQWIKVSFKLALRISHVSHAQSCFADQFVCVNHLPRRLILWPLSLLGLSGQIALLPNNEKRHHQRGDLLGDCAHHLCRPNPIPPVDDASQSARRQRVNCVSQWVSCGAGKWVCDNVDGKEGTKELVLLHVEIPVRSGLFLVSADRRRCSDDGGVGDVFKDQANTPTPSINNAWADAHFN